MVKPYGQFLSTDTFSTDTPAKKNLTIPSQTRWTDLLVRAPQVQPHMNRFCNYAPQT